MFWVPVFEATGSGYGVVYFSVTQTQSIAYIKKTILCNTKTIYWHLKFIFKYALVLIKVVTLLPWRSTMTKENSYKGKHLEECLHFQRVSSLSSWWQAERLDTRTVSHWKFYILISRSVIRKRGCGPGVGFWKLSNPTPSDTSTLTRPHLQSLPVVHQLGTMHANIWTQEGHVSFI